MLTDSQMKLYSDRFRQLGSDVRVKIRKPNGVIAHSERFQNRDPFLQFISRFEGEIFDGRAWTIQIETANESTAKEKAELSRIFGPLHIFYALFSERADMKVRDYASNENPTPLAGGIIDVDLLSHFKGSAMIGSFPVLEDGICCGFACIRGIANLEQADRIRERGAELGLNLYTEDSGELNQGFRSWLFLFRPIEFERVRAVLKMIAKEVDASLEVKPKNKDDSIYLPYFNLAKANLDFLKERAVLQKIADEEESQDSEAKGGSPQRNCGFVDDEKSLKAEDKGGFLYKIKRTSEKVINRIIDEQNLNLTEEVEETSDERLKILSLPADLRCVLGSEELTQVSKARLKKELEITNLEAFKILQTLGDLELLLSKKSVNSPSKIDEARLRELEDKYPALFFIGE